MKQLGKYVSAVALAFTLASVVACASTHKQEGTGEYVDDSVITTKVKAAILNEPTLKSPRSTSRPSRARFNCVAS